MELTGKTKIEFEEWYLLIKHFDSLTVFESGKINQFNNLPENMRYGVYVDYFDSLKIYIEDMFLEGGLQWGYAVSVQIREGWTQLSGESEGLKSRIEARTAAIEKANEIRNEQLNK